MKESTHPNSHYVYIRRKALFDTAERPELEEFFAGSSVSVGSYFGNGTRPGSGLTIGEENLLMPFVIGIPKDDRDFRTKINDHFANINSKIPAMSIPARDDDGLKLDIGLEKGNAAPLSEDNMPINIEQYVRHRQISNHPWVGADPEEALGDQMKKFYIYDPSQVQTTTLSANDRRDAALLKYITIKDNVRKVRMYLTLLGKTPASIRKGEELSTLRKLAEDNPTGFLKVAADKDLELKYMIEELVFYKVLTRVGDRVLNNDVEIGRTMQEAVLYLKDSHNTAVFTALKARLNNEWTKNSVSVETEEDLMLTDSNRETDEQLEQRLKKQEDVVASTIDRTRKAAASVPVEEPKATGLDIKTTPEEEVELVEGALGSIDAGTDENDVIGEGPAEIPNDGRAAELTPDKIK